MVEMPVRRGDDLDVACLEAERFDARLNEGIGARRAGIDEDQSSTGVDQIAAKIVGTDKNKFPTILNPGNGCSHSLLVIGTFTRCWAIAASVATADRTTAAARRYLNFMGVPLRFPNGRLFQRSLALAGAQGEPSPIHAIHDDDP
jgi:hypothetical protein